MEIPEFKDIFLQIEINFWLLGISSNDSRICVRFYILLLLIIIMVFGEICFFVSTVPTDNFLELTQLAPCICIGFLSIAKIILLSLKRQKIFKLSDQLYILYHDIVNDFEKKNVVINNFIFLKYLTSYFFILNTVLIVVYNFSTPLIMVYHYVTKREVVFILPYALLLPFSTNSWITWAAVYFYSIICGFICVLFFTTVDALYFITTTHICSNFNLISNEIQHLNANNTSNFKKIIKKHQYILKLSQDLEDIFTAPNLFNVLVGSLEICALGFNLTMGGWYQIPGVVLFLTSVLLQIMMMSVYGETMITESKKVGEAAYICEWYNMEQKYKKIILLLMTRANKPQKLTAYNFSTISYASFTRIISTSWSYFTILKTVYNPKQQ